MVDVIVIGAGHNGLVAATVLARSGLDVLVLDSVTWPGGMAGFHVVGGVRVPIGAYVIGLMPQELINELGINIKPYKPDPIAVYDKNGELVRWWIDVNRRIEEFDRWGLGNNIGAMIEELRSFWNAFKKYMFRTEPPSKSELMSDPVLSKFLRMTSSEFLSQYLPREFWDMFIFEPYLNQPAFMIGYYNPATDWWFPSKDGDVGMDVFAEELYRTALRSGANVLLGLGVKKIVVERNRVKGVVTDDDRLIEARAVLSTASPINTMLELVGEEYLEDSVINHLRRAWATAGAYRLVIVGYDKIKLKGEWDNYRSSILQLPFGETVVKDNYLIVTGLPTLDELRNYVEIKPEDIKAFEVIGPRDYESIFRVAGGNLNHLPMFEEYMFENRPYLGWGYKTPIKGLYLGGAGTFPGGQLTGLPGYNSARKLLSEWSNM